MQMMGKYYPIDWTERESYVEAISLQIKWFILRMLR